uniref:Mutator-like transposase domain-containing protein n=1 Tax=Trichogramma kaykai TaxID=54128 RepID=A0ABD2X7K0_9HYME
MTQKRKSYGKGSKNCKPAKKKCVRRSHEFTGNQYTADMQTDFTSSSAKKLSSNREFDVKVDETFSYCILAFNLVFSALAELLKCKICNSDVKFTQTNVRGLGFKINIECQCGDRTINSCPMINTGNEINRRIVFVLRLLGVGIHGVRLFCSLMELSSNFNVTRYYYILENIKIATHAVSEACLKKAGEEEKEENKENNMPEDELTVSGDGTWSKRGLLNPEINCPPWTTLFFRDHTLTPSTCKKKG